MKTNNKKTVAIILTLLMIIICFTTSIVPVKATNEIKETQFIANQNAGTKQNDKILKYFEQLNTTRGISYNENKSLGYPEYYGGSYLNEQGNLVVLLKSNNNNSNAIYLLRNVSENDSLNYEYVKYSLSELTSYIKLIKNYKQNNGNDLLAQDITSWALYDKDNIIEVCIKNLTTEKINLFKKNIINTDAIIFKNVTDTPQFCSDIDDEDNTSSSGFLIYAGTPVSVNGIRQISLGFPAYRDINNGRQYGFVTCAHNVYVDDYISTEDGATSAPINRIGTVEMRRLGYQYDVSFVSLESDERGSCAIDDTFSTLIPSNEEISYPVAGKKVHVDSRYKNSASGNILSTNFSGTTEGVYFENLVKISVKVKKGDSGGLVSSDGFIPLQRVQEGIISQRDVDNYALVCSAHNIVNLWYLTCY